MKKWFAVAAMLVGVCGLASAASDEAGKCSSVTSAFHGMHKCGWQPSSPQDARKYEVQFIKDGKVKSTMHLTAQPGNATPAMEYTTIAYVNECDANDGTARLGAGEVVARDSLTVLPATNSDFAYFDWETIDFLGMKRQTYGACVLDFPETKSVKSVKQVKIEVGGSYKEQIEGYAISVKRTQ